MLLQFYYNSTYGIYPALGMQFQLVYLKKRVRIISAQMVLKNAKMGTNYPD